MKKSLRAWRSTLFIHMKQTFARATFKFCVLVSPLLYTFIFYYMFKNSGQEDFATYIVLSSSMLSLWSSICFSSAGDLQRERDQGTLEFIYVSLMDFRFIVSAKILANTILGIIPFFISFFSMKIIFSEPIYIANKGYFILSFFTTILSYVGIAMIFSNLFTLSRKATILMNCCEYPIFILCGFVVPVEKLPVILKPISVLLSPTWGVEIIRMSIEGIKNIQHYWLAFGTLCFLTIIYILISIFLFKVIDKKVRIKGNLGVA